MSYQKSLNIILIEPFYAGSHKSWADSYQKYSRHTIHILSLKGIYWKWRMHGGAITLAQMFNRYISNNPMPDIILTTDMLNLPVFTAFAKINTTPIVTFFHENQLTYPWSSQDRDKLNKRDHHYGFINYTTALKSNLVMFNSDFHKNDFIHALTKFLKQFPDHKELKNIDLIKKKSVTAHLGLELKKFDLYQIKTTNKSPIILWNHRWEYDKNPRSFFECLKKIKSKKIPFDLVILGEQFDTEMNIFTQARRDFKKHIIHIGYCDSFKDYAEWLWKADILPVTTNQEFFGASVMEAVYCNTIPILPKRLSYPELFQIKKNQKNFYNDERELTEKLINLLIQHNNNQSLSQYASIFDWSVIASKYDQLLSHI